MTRTSPRFTQSEITRAVNGAKAAGFLPSTIRIDRSGNIHLSSGSTAESQTMENEWDSVLKGESNVSHKT